MTSASPRQNWLTLGAASAQMGVSESTIRRWADTGEVRSYRTAGGHRRVLEDLVPGVLREGMSEMELSSLVHSLLVAEGHHGVVRFAMFDTEIAV